MPFTAFAFEKFEFAKRRGARLRFKRKEKTSRREAIITTTVKENNVVVSSPPKKIKKKPKKYSRPAFFATSAFKRESELAFFPSNES